jgi:hypothetical protein
MTSPKKQQKHCSIRYDAGTICCTISLTLHRMSPSSLDVTIKLSFPISFLEFQHSITLLDSSVTFYQFPLSGLLVNSFGPCTGCIDVGDPLLHTLAGCPGTPCRKPFSVLVIDPVIEDYSSIFSSSWKNGEWYSETQKSSPLRSIGHRTAFSVFAEKREAF